MAESTRLFVMATVGVLLQLHLLIDAQIDPPYTACPLKNDNCTEDTVSCSLDGCDKLSWCCTNTCGGWSCVLVKAPCIVNSVEFKHRMVISDYRDYENNDCGKCWCYNGDVQCLHFKCYGPFFFPQELWLNRKEEKVGR